MLVFEDWLFCRFDLYAIIFSLIVSAMNLLPTFQCVGLIPCKWDKTVTRGYIWPSQYCYRHFSPPNCISGWHGHVCCYFYYLIESHVALCWYQNFWCYCKSPSTPSDDPCSYHDPFAWFDYPFYLCLLWSTIYCSCWLTVYITSLLMAPPETLTWFFQHLILTIFSFAMLVTGYAST